jgi:ankyrin repeat protein
MPRLEVEEKSGMARRAILAETQEPVERIVKRFRTPLIFLNATDQISGAALRWAAANGWIDYLSLFYQRRGGNFEQEDHYGRTPLSWAAGNGCDNVVKWLLEKGSQASLQKTDRKDRSPLSWSVGNGRVEASRLLLATAEYRLDQKDIDGRTPLSLAAGNGCGKTVELLLNGEHEIDPDQPDNMGRTPLLWSAEKGCIEAVLSLLSFDKLSEDGQSEARQQLVDFDHKDHGGRTPLSWAAQNEHAEVVRILTEEGLQRYPDLNTGTDESPSWATRYLHEASASSAMDPCGSVGWELVSSLSLMIHPVVDGLPCLLPLHVSVLTAFPIECILLLYSPRPSTVAPRCIGQYILSCTKNRFLPQSTVPSKVQSLAKSASPLSLNFWR